VIASKAIIIFVFIWTASRSISEHLLTR